MEGILRKMTFDILLENPSTLSAEITIKILEYESLQLLKYKQMYIFISAQVIKIRCVFFNDIFRVRIVLVPLQRGPETSRLQWKS